MWRRRRLNGGLVPDYIGNFVGERDRLGHAVE
jgi:hypothetical protein